MLENTGLILPLFGAGSRTAKESLAKSVSEAVHAERPGAPAQIVALQGPLGAASTPTNRGSEVK